MYILEAFLLWLFSIDRCPYVTLPQIIVVLDSIHWPLPLLPLAFIPNVIATSHYKDFSTSSKVSNMLLNITLAISLVSLLGAVVLVGPFVRIFYGSEFAPVIKLTYIVSFGILLNGLGDFFNRFLGSHGKGKALRNSAFIVGISVMMFNVILIPMFGEYGAALTTFISGLIYFVCMYIYYRRLVSALLSVK